MTKHPAKYSDNLLPVIQAALVGYNRVLDPFAGTGKIKEIRPDAYMVEIEPEWASMNKSIIANTLYMPFDYGAFDAIATSPCYGNRMADSFVDGQPDKKYRRNTYTHTLGRKLHKDNSGHMQWGNRYRQFHEMAWNECRNVLRHRGRLVLNISDHIRGGKRMPVTQWHIDMLRYLDFNHLATIDIKTKRNKMGQNRNARVECEHIIIMEKD